MQQYNIPAYGYESPEFTLTLNLGLWMYGVSNSVIDMSYLLGIVEEEINQLLLSLNVVKEDKERPVKEPGALLELEEVRFR